MLKFVVLCSVLAAAAASAPFAYTVPFAYSSALLTPYSSNYRGPLSLAPGQPANILAADGRPLDTLDVNLDRSAHLTAKALEGGLHYLKKRSAPFAAVTYTSPLIAHSAPLAYSAPAIAPLAPISYAATPVYGAGLHYIKKRSAPIAVVARGAYSSPLIAHSAPLAYSASVISPVAPISYAATPFYGAGVHYIKKRSAPFAPITHITYRTGVASHSAPGIVPVAPISYAAAPYARYTYY
ncbi:unnamed protein product [Chrysodeixis includens]|uniref:Uncharacterized protein n=1 Tax=Chrysodeixis includens TaxID=689277 RepID=A0A9N8KT49_CHRIL|nr:unnamed protein product [Chrysodeixis includens]